MTIWPRKWDKKEGTKMKGKDELPVLKQGSKKIDRGQRKNMKMNLGKR